MLGPRVPELSLGRFPYGSTRAFVGDRGIKGRLSVGPSKQAFCPLGLH